MKPVVKRNYDKVKEIIFNGKEIHNIEHSLFQVGNEYVLIQGTEPKSEECLFGINTLYLDKVKYVVLICDNYNFAFKIPVEIFKENEFSFDKKTERLLTTVGLNKINEYMFDWYLVRKKEEGVDTRIDINIYSFYLKNDEEIMEQAIGMRSLLNIK